MKPQLPAAAGGGECSVGTEFQIDEMGKFWRFMHSTMSVYVELDTYIELRW